MMIVLRGDGIAALTCGYLLQRAGFGVAIERTSRTYLPALMLSASSQSLFRDILELRDAFSSLPRIQRRVVKWGPGSEPVALPHSAVVVSEQFLLEMVHSGREIRGQTGECPFSDQGIFELKKGIHPSDPEFPARAKNSR